MGCASNGPLNQLEPPRVDSAEAFAHSDRVELADDVVPPPAGALATMSSACPMDTRVCILPPWGRPTEWLAFELGSARGASSACSPNATRDMLVLDHVFIMCDVGAPGAMALSHVGLEEMPRNTHPGQGTACRRFSLADRYLELLWVRDEHETRSDRGRPTQLWESCRVATAVKPLSGSGRRYAVVASPAGVTYRRHRRARPLPP